MSRRVNVLTRKTAKVVVFIDDSSDCFYRTCANSTNGYFRLGLRLRSYLKLNNYHTLTVHLRNVSFDKSWRMTVTKDTIEMSSICIKIYNNSD